MGHPYYLFIQDARFYLKKQMLACIRLLLIEVKEKLQRKHPKGCGSSPSPTLQIFFSFSLFLFDVKRRVLFTNYFVLYLNFGKEYFYTFLMRIAAILDFFQGEHGHFGQHFESVLKTFFYLVYS